MKITSKVVSTTSDMTTMKAMAMMTMTLMNRQKRNKRWGVAEVVVLIVIWNNYCRSMEGD